MRLLQDTNIDFMKYRKFWVAISLALIVVFFIALFAIHLHLGIDFAGGTQVTLRFRERPQIEQLRSLLASAGMGEAEIQRFDKEELNEAIIRTPVVKGAEEAGRQPVVAALNRHYNQGQTGKADLNQAGADGIIELLSGSDPDHVGATTAPPPAPAPTPAGAPGAKPADAPAPTLAASPYAKIAEALLVERRKDGLFADWNAVARTPGLSPAALATLKDKSFLGDYAVLGTVTVGPQIGQELRRQGFWAVVLSLFGMLAYIGLRFELRFGIGAVMASLHDVLITLGLFILMGFEFNLITVAAFLTLIGYSTNDTVVIFDRMRENMRKNRRKPLIEIMNESINQTLSRTIMTSGLTMLTVAALLFLGGDVLRGFSFVMTVGIIIGTYSSVYIASPFALLWEQMFGAKSRIRGEAAAAGARPAGAGARPAGSAAGSAGSTGSGNARRPATGAPSRPSPTAPAAPSTAASPSDAAAPRPRSPQAAGRRRSGRR